MLALFLPAALLQNEAVTGLTPGQVNMLMIFAGAVTLAVIIQVLLIIGMAVGAAKARKEIVRLTTEIHGKAMPLIHNVTAIVEEATPKIKNTIDSVEEIALIARKKAVEIDSLSTEMIMRARQEGRRVDGMVSHTLDKVEHLRDTVNHALMAPVRQAAGAIAAIKSGFEKLKDNIPSGLQYVAGFVKRGPDAVTEAVSSAFGSKPTGAPSRPAAGSSRPTGPYAGASSSSSAAPRSYASATQSSPAGGHNPYGSIELDVEPGRSAAGSSYGSGGTNPGAGGSNYGSGSGASAGSRSGSSAGAATGYGSAQGSESRPAGDRYASDPRDPRSAGRPTHPEQPSGQGTGVPPRNYASGSSPNAEHNRYGSIEVNEDRGVSNRYGEPSSAPRRADFNSSREREKQMGEGDEYHA